MQVILEQHGHAAEGPLGKLILASTRKTYPTIVTETLLQTQRVLFTCTTHTDALHSHEEDAH